MEAIKEEKRKRGSQNGKYALITYLVEQKKMSIQQIIHLAPKEALELLPADDEQLMNELKKYLTKNVNKMKKWENQYFFPGQNRPTADERSVLHELHFYLQSLTPPRTLSDIGLASRPIGSKEVKAIHEAEEPEDIMNWAKKMFE